SATSSSGPYGRRPPAALLMPSTLTTRRPRLSVDFPSSDLPPAPSFPLVAARSPEVPIRQRYSVPLARARHSASGTLRARRITETEGLVDGKECAFHRVHGHGAYPLTLATQVAEEPPKPLAVRLERTGRAEHPLSCVLELSGAEHPMPERTAR